MIFRHPALPAVLLYAAQQVVLHGQRPCCMVGLCCMSTHSTDTQNRTESTKNWNSERGGVLSTARAQNSTLYGSSLLSNTGALSGAWRIKNANASWKHTCQERRHQSQWSPNMCRGCGGEGNCTCALAVQPSRRFCTAGAARSAPEELALNCGRGRTTASVSAAACAQNCLESFTRT